MQDYHVGLYTFERPVELDMILSVGVRYLMGYMAVSIWRLIHLRASYNPYLQQISYYYITYTFLFFLLKAESILYEMKYKQLIER